MNIFNSSKLRTAPPGSTQTDVPVGSRTPRAGHETWSHVEWPFRVNLVVVNGRKKEFDGMTCEKSQ